MPACEGDGSDKRVLADGTFERLVEPGEGGVHPYGGTGRWRTGKVMRSSETCRSPDKLFHAAVLFFAGFP